MLWTNMEQLYQTYSVKLNRTKNNAIRFIPYMEMDPEKVFQMVENLSSLLDREDFEKFVSCNIVHRGGLWKYTYHDPNDFNKFLHSQLFCIYIGVKLP